MVMQRVTRRLFVTSVGAASVLPTSAVLGAAQGTEPAKETAPTPAGTTTPDISVADRPTYLFFNEAEVLFIEAACERLIPADESGTGALGAGVPNYLDKQLGGAWGAGERLYRSGPWAPGTPQQGYQLPFTPAELFRNCLRAIDHKCVGGNTLSSSVSGTPTSAT